MNADMKKRLNADTVAPGYLGTGYVSMSSSAFISLLLLSESYLRQKRFVR
jgi:hypothetical protein